MLYMHMLTQWLTGGGGGLGAFINVCLTPLLQIVS